MDNKLTKARKALEQGDLSSVFALLEEDKSGENNPEVNMLLGLAYYKLQRWGDALNRFRAIVAVEPENRNAKGYIDMIENILKFYHKDLYNP